jgi:hypothetical protein
MVKTIRNLTLPDFISWVGFECLPQRPAGADAGPLTEANSRIPSGLIWTHGRIPPSGSAFAFSRTVSPGKRTFPLQGREQADQGRPLIQEGYFEHPKIDIKTKFTPP